MAPFESHDGIGQQEDHSQHYNRTFLEGACPKDLLKKNCSVHESEGMSDGSAAATCSR